MSRKSPSRFLTACGAAALLAAGLGNGSALAAQLSNSFEVRANVIAVCTISAGDLIFNDYDPFGGNEDATSTILVTCTDQAPWEIQLSAGGSGNVNARQMSDGGTGTLNYELHRASDYASNWGVTLGGGGDTRTGTGTGAQESITVYGRIPGGQTGVAVGTYTDTVDATINF